LTESVVIAERHFVRIFVSSDGATSWKETNLDLQTYDPRGFFICGASETRLFFIGSDDTNGIRTCRYIASLDGGLAWE
jgi:hypothetical protein